MITSMTGFSRSEAKNDQAEAVWEIRSVNHRYLDITVRLPDDLRYLEMQVRNLISKHLHRGKVEAILTLFPTGAMLEEIALNLPLVQQLIEVNDKVCYHSHLPAFDVGFLLRWPGVIQTKQVVTPELDELILSLCDENLKKLHASREKEGSKIKQFLSQRVDNFTTLLENINNSMETYMLTYRNRIIEKIREFKEEIEPGRLEKELAFLLQKADVAEETSRLESHLQQVRSYIDQGGAVGRRLDFFMQELNREANTLGSKSIDINITEAVVEFKVLIEQMREQINNIE
ncbi:MAG: YicC/YloC family endoribonuclease, partial [Pseudomonadota bacterium]